MSAQTILSIDIENLLLNLSNPRHDPQISQRGAISAIAHEQKTKLANLAEDIVEKGLNPTELLLVTPADEHGMYIVVEGNRRIAAIKLVTSPSLLTSIGLTKSLENDFKVLHAVTSSNLPSNINCAVLSTEETKHWISLKHTGENEGVGVVDWDGRAKQRFRGSSPALQAIDLVEANNLLDKKAKENLAKISITNVDRIINTPEARKALGVDVKDGKLIFTSNENESLGKLAILVNDVANRRIRVTHIDTKQQRVEYAQSITVSPSPNSSGEVNPPANGSATPPTSPSQPQPAKKAAKSTKRVSLDRKVLIPSSFKLAIQQARLNRIYHELQELPVETFRNSCSVMLRVFIELSVDHFAKLKSIPLIVIPPPPVDPTTPPTQKKPWEMTLREKLTTVVEHLRLNNLATSSELKGVESLIANKKHVLSIDTLHAYVHNKDYNPTASELKTNWDNIQTFVEKLWSV